MQEHRLQSTSPREAGAAMRQPQAAFHEESTGFPSDQIEDFVDLLKEPFDPDAILFTGGAWPKEVPLPTEAMVQAIIAMGMIFNFGEFTNYPGTPATADELEAVATYNWLPVAVPAPSADQCTPGNVFVRNAAGVTACIQSYEDDQFGISAAVRQLDAAGVLGRMRLAEGTPIDAGRLAEDLLTNIGAFAAVYEPTRAGWRRLTDMLIAGAGMVASATSEDDNVRPLLVVDSGYVPGLPGDAPTTQPGLTLPPDPAARLQAAGVALAQFWPAAVALPTDEATLKRVIQGLLGLGYAISNFGLVTTPEGPIETNNWFLAGTAPVDGACPAGSIFDPSSNRCVVLASSVQQGVDAVGGIYGYYPDFQKALATGDVARLAEAIFATPLVGVPLTAELKPQFVAMVDRLNSVMAEVASRFNDTNSWSKSDYIPAVFGGGTGTTEPPTQEKPEEEEKKSYAWAWWVAGAAAVLGVGYAVLKNAKPSESAAYDRQGDDQAF